MWFIYALIAGVFFAINSLMIRHYARKNEDMWILSFYFSFIGSIISLPLFLYEFRVSYDWTFWGGILLIGVILVINNILGFKAARLLGATTQNVFGKLKLIWLLIAGIVVFGEVITLQKGIGMILIMAASLLILDYNNWKASKQGIILIILATFTSAIYGVLLKRVLGMSGVLTMIFLVAIVPAILNAIVIPDFWNRAKKEFINIKSLIAICIIGIIANLSMIKALSYNVLSGVYFIMDASLIIIIFGEHFILKEKERVIWKIIAAAFAIAGAILLQI